MNCLTLCSGNLAIKLFVSGIESIEIILVEISFKIHQVLSAERTDQG